MLSPGQRLVAFNTWNGNVGGDIFVVLSLFRQLMALFQKCQLLGSFAVLVAGLSGVVLWEPSKNRVFNAPKTAFSETWSRRARYQTTDTMAHFHH